MLKIEGDIPFGKDQFYRRLYGWVARVAPSHIQTSENVHLKPASILFLSNFAC